MNREKAFDLLKCTGGTSAARIIMNWRKDNPSRFWVWLTAQRLHKNTPVAKIIGEKWFYGLRFYTNKHTLDPRPDSETLIEAVLSEKTCGISVLDIGTGTACLICALCKNLPGATGVAIDKSRKALAVARKNVKDLSLDERIKVLYGDFNNLNSIDSLFDIIISNPPYIAPMDFRVNDAALHDPKMALYSGKDGLDAYRAIASGSKGLLKPGGRIYLEIGENQTASVREIFEGAVWTFKNVHKDLGGIERVLVFEKITH